MYKLNFCYRQHCAQRKPPVFNLLRGQFWGFSPRRSDTLHRWGWNLARSSPPCQISKLNTGGLRCAQCCRKQ